MTKAQFLTLHCGGRMPSLQLFRPHLRKSAKSARICVLNYLYTNNPYIARRGVAPYKTIRPHPRESASSVKSALPFSPFMHKTALWLLHQGRSFHVIFVWFLLTTCSLFFNINIGAFHALREEHIARRAGG